MKSKRPTGFVLVLVILILVLIGSYMFVLADTAGTLSMQADQALVQARSRNLQASGLAWAARNRAKTPAEDLARGVDLDVSALRAGQLRVSLTEAGLCRITTECRSGRFASKGDEVFAMDKGLSPNAGAAD